MENVVFGVLLVFLCALIVARASRRTRLRKQRRREPYGKVIFLDFDGVLHRGVSETFEHLEAFERILKARPDTSIVISSDWRRGRTLEELKSLFSPSLREQIIDVTPQLSYDDRQLEIETFCRLHRVRRCLIIDDSEALFPRDNLNIYFTNPKTGLTKNDLEFIDQWLREA